ncbi:hypothetical protein PILCRDRAFT_539046 [Piloderma croceum F 1598]|uniref:Uncharacterized protein n=1 Tax=Piloderma croceum (strain F 1598) TaxID=765440 RepID=A0A0C3FL17_PILCF|nr:hypothetical protein PILCRDRAFT_539046 [Piloderma croceum F 1598]
MNNFYREGDLCHNWATLSPLKNPTDPDSTITQILIPITAIGDIIGVPSKPVDSIPSPKYKRNFTTQTTPNPTSTHPRPTSRDGLLDPAG